MESIHDEDEWILVDNPNCPGISLLEEGEIDPGLPRDNPTEAAWQIPPDPLLQHFRFTEDLPTTLLDVVIIGSGLSGTSVAWHLLRDNTSTRKLSALMLEARDVCSGATGRNGIPCDILMQAATYLVTFIRSILRPLDFMTRNKLR
jgi:hypothetical protein